MGEVGIKAKDAIYLYMHAPAHKECLSLFDISSQLICNVDALFTKYYGMLKQKHRNVTILFTLQTDLATYIS